MATYKALVLQDSDRGGAHRVFLIKSEAMEGLPLPELLAVQQYAHERYNLALTPVDLEVIALDDLKARLRAMHRGR